MGHDWNNQPSAADYAALNAQDALAQSAHLEQRVARLERQVAQLERLLFPDT